MRKRHVVFTPGTLFLVPLHSGGDAVGLIARSSPKGKILFGYFFGPEGTKEPTASELQGLTPHDAIFLARFGDLGLCEGLWTVLGGLSRFDPARWAMPPFRRTDVVSGVVRLIHYADSDPAKEIACVESRDPVAQTLPEDGLFGYEAVQIRLAIILRRTPGAAEDLEPGRA